MGVGVHTKVPAAFWAAVGRPRCGLVLGPELRIATSANNEFEMTVAARSQTEHRSWACRGAAQKYYGRDYSGDGSLRLRPHCFPYTGERNAEKVGAPEP